jgi:hypothetical protein
MTWVDAADARLAEETFPTRVVADRVEIDVP